MDLLWLCEQKVYLLPSKSKRMLGPATLPSQKYSTSQRLLCKSFFITVLTFLCGGLQPCLVSAQCLRCPHTRRPALSKYHQLSFMFQPTWAWCRCNETNWPAGTEKKRSQCTERIERHRRTKAGDKAESEMQTWTRTPQRIDRAFVRAFALQLSFGIFHHCPLHMDRVEVNVASIPYISIWPHAIKCVLGIDREKKHSATIEDGPKRKWLLYTDGGQKVANRNQEAN